MLEAKKGSDVRNYTEAAALYKKVARDSSADVLDPTWATKQEKKNNAETARLENELKGYKNNLIKESIRVRKAPSEMFLECLQFPNHPSRWGMKI